MIEYTSCVAELPSSWPFHSPRSLHELVCILPTSFQARSVQSHGIHSLRRKALRHFYSALYHFFILYSNDSKRGACETLMKQRESSSRKSSFKSVQPGRLTFHLFAPSRTKRLATELAQLSVHNSPLCVRTGRRGRERIPPSLHSRSRPKGRLFGRGCAL
jgi:hypothetical protein